MIYWKNSKSIAMWWSVALHATTTFPARFPDQTSPIFFIQPTIRYHWMVMSECKINLKENTYVVLGLAWAWKPTSESSMAHRWFIYPKASARKWVLDIRTWNFELAYTTTVNYCEKILQRWQNDWMCYQRYPQIFIHPAVQKLIHSHGADIFIYPLNAGRGIGTEPDDWTMCFHLRKPKFGSDTEHHLCCYIQ